MAEEYQASRVHLKDFMQGFVWHDFKLILTEWIEQQRITLETAGKGFHADGSNVTLNDVAFIQGEIVRMRLMLDLPQTLIDNMETEEEEQDG